MPHRSAELRVFERRQRAKVTEVFMAVVGQPDGEGENLFAVAAPNQAWLPLVAMDRKSLAILKKFSQNVANARGETVSIICFTDRRVHESVMPVVTRK